MPGIFTSTRVRGVNLDHKCMEDECSSGYWVESNERYGIVRRIVEGKLGAGGKYEENIAIFCQQHR